MSKLLDSSWSRLLLWVCLAGFLQAGAAPAEPPSGAPLGGAADAPASPAQALRERAQAYWEARIAGSRLVYSFYPPATPPDMVAEGGSLRHSGFEIADVQVSEDSAWVSLEVRLDAIGLIASRLPKGEGYPDLRSATIAEEWVRVEGVWYKKPRPRGLSRLMGRRGPRAE